jgi:hypothetical protein
VNSASAYRAKKSENGAAVGAALVRAADVGREEFEEAHGGTVAGSADKRRP